MMYNISDNFVKKIYIASKKSKFFRYNKYVQKYKQQTEKG